jgi:6-phosphogluconolactonase
MVAVKKNKQINIFLEPKAVFDSAAKDFTRRAIEAVNKKGVFTVALSGGTTPKFLFDALVTIKACREKTPWQHIKFFFSDERYVPHDNPKSNYRTAYAHLFSKISVPAENIYPIPTQFSDPHYAAKIYEATLRKVLPSPPTPLPKLVPAKAGMGEGRFNVSSPPTPFSQTTTLSSRGAQSATKDLPPPLFDLIYLGLGENAHTASLMPFTQVVTSPPKQLVVALKASDSYRITLTPFTINHATCIIFLVTGQNKASAVWNVLEGSYEPSHYPAQLIHSIDGKTIWYLDAAAAKKLSPLSKGYV